MTCMDVAGLVSIFCHCIHIMVQGGVLVSPHPPSSSNPDGIAQVLDGDELYAANLGDSGFMVVRGGNIIFQSPQQQHGFNYPYQLGNAGTGAISDPPSAAQTFSIKVGCASGCASVCTFLCQQLHCCCATSPLCYNRCSKAILLWLALMGCWTMCFQTRQLLL